MSDTAAELTFGGTTRVLLREIDGPHYYDKCRVLDTSGIVIATGTIEETIRPEDLEEVIRLVPGGHTLQVHDGYSYETVWNLSPPAIEITIEANDGLRMRYPRTVEQTPEAAAMLVQSLWRGLDQYVRDRRYTLEVGSFRVPLPAHDRDGWGDVFGVALGIDRWDPRTGSPTRTVRQELIRRWPNAL